ncbi:hypothetical protein FSP39_008650 [Pinctada imbricata]|uniref:THAP-type domain-containing protein n=1 Tax=Pinctada imbricata TaxID=66713 RepID=A0AA88XI59_PINIB|nr:hypothetical protein FSP39_008650 [Pinctada imbricata]
MVKRCCYGTCNSNSRYPERLDGAKFIPFPKKISNHDKCMRWIKACGRPHYQLNIENITKDTYICSKHFVGGNGPTLDNPDPIPADGSTPRTARKPIKRIVQADHADTKENGKKTKRRLDFNGRFNNKFNLE